MINQPADPIIEVRALDVRIGQCDVCRKLDFSLQPGKQLVILGRNGVGKSTLLNVLAGLRSPDAGVVKLAGKPAGDYKGRDAARLRGWLGQYRPDGFASSVLETALTGRHPHLSRWHWEGDDDIALARAALGAVGLEGFETRDVQTLSGGERQRLSVAAVLAQSPRVYLLDEPLTHLDLNHQIAVLDLFAGLAKEKNSTVIMVLHDPGLARRYCDQALLIFGDGETLHGNVEDVVRAEPLSRLYNYRLREFALDGGQWFVPE